MAEPTTPQAPQPAEDDDAQDRLAEALDVEAARSDDADEEDIAADDAGATAMVEKAGRG